MEKEGKHIHHQLTSVTVIFKRLVACISISMKKYQFVKMKNIQCQFKHDFSGNPKIDDQNNIFQTKRNETITNQNIEDS